MAPEWIYLLKVNVGIALFYAFYKLFCCRDTFFRWRRFAILSFLGISFLYPFVNIQDWIKEQPNMVELADYYASWMWSEEVVVTPTTQVAQTPDLMTTAMYIYFIGVVALSIRFLIQLCSILYMRGKGTVTYLKGQRIISIPTEVNPFSFFQWIFIHQQRINEENLDEILMHEQTHAKQWHSIDVVLSEIINIVCWFNPFSWLLKNEIRLNLEYLADNQVTEIVEDAKVYQYHLLGLASQKRQTGLYNNFNVSHLKHRIIMMNKKRTCTAGRIKYALFAPLAIALLLASNISCVSNEKKAEQTAETPTATPALQEVESTSRETEPPTEKLIFTVVEEMPEFTGGMGECMKFINKNIQYPPEAIEKEIQGRVIVQMVITDEGDVTDAKVVRGVDPLLDKEALRVINLMPKWKPGKQRGKAVNVKYTIPVMFRLSGGNDVEAESKDTPANVDEKAIFTVCEEMATFPGGMTECMKFLSKNVDYPKEAQDNGIQGRVIVQFVVKKDGSITDAKVVRGVDPSLDKEALRIINLMPKWTPGKQRGKAVNVKYTVPVMFRLQ